MLALANQLIIDFTPDAEAPDGPDPGSFASIFNPSYWQGKTRYSDNHTYGTANPNTSLTDAQLTRQFLDWNKDGTLSVADANEFQKDLSKYVRNFYSAFSKSPDLNVKVLVKSDGWNQLNQSRNDPNLNRYVIFVGANDFVDNGVNYGVAAQAPEDLNFEYYGYAFVGEIANKMWSTALSNAQKGITPVYGVGDTHEFSRRVSITVAHEMGHLLGLGHVKNQPETLMSYQANKWSAGFPNQAFDNADVRVDLAGNFADLTQNPYQELYDSFLNQDAIFLKDATYPNGLPYVASLPDEDWQFLAPVKSAPPASQGSAAGLTIPQIATSIATGFGNVQQSTLFDQFATQLGVSPSQVPILTQNILTTLGLDGSSLANLLLKPNQPGYTPTGSLDMSGIATLSQLGTRLQQAGFNVNSILNDAEFTSLPSSAPADIVRFTRVYTLAELTGSDSFNASLFSNQQEIKDIAPSGTIGFDATATIYLTFGLDTAGFYLLAGKTAEAKFDGSGELTGGLAGAGTLLGVGSLSYAKSVDIKTSHADGKIRLTDLSLPSGQLLQAQPIVGSTGVKLQFNANLGALGNVKWDGGWNWKSQPAPPSSVWEGN